MRAVTAVRASWLLVPALLLACEGPRPPTAPPAPGGLEALARHDPLVPSRDVESARRVRALAGEVEAALKVVSGVQDARVVLTLPGRTGPGGPTARAQAAVVVRWDGVGEPPVTEQGVRRLAVAAVPGLEPGAVDVLLSAPPVTAPPTCDLVRVGPLTVTRASRGPLLGVVGALGGACCLLAGWLVARGLLSRRRGAPRGWPG